jgi:hypothetical protein
MLSLKVLPKQRVGGKEPFNRLVHIMPMIRHLLRQLLMQNMGNKDLQSQPTVMEILWRLQNSLRKKGKGS